MKKLILLLAIISVSISFHVMKIDFLSHERFYGFDVKERAVLPADIEAPAAMCQINRGAYQSWLVNRCDNDIMFSTLPVVYETSKVKGT